MVESTSSTAKEPEQLSFVQRVRRHKLYSYFCTEGTIGILAYGVGVLVGSYFSTHEVTNFVTALGSTGSGAMIRGILELTIGSPFLYFVDKDIYNNGKSKLKEFGARFVVYTLVNNALEIGLGSLSLTYFLDNKLPLQVLPFGNDELLFGRLPASLVTIPTNALIYTALVLKTNPFPQIAARAKHVANTAGAIKDRAMAAAYSASAFFPKF